VIKMVNEIIATQAKENSAYHTFTLEQASMDLVFSNGSYIQGNTERFTTDVGATVSIPSSASDTHYEIWISNAGLAILSRLDSEEFGEVTNPIDRLAWFTVPASTVSLDNIEINFVKVSEG
jgi:hypothetical protein